MKIAGAYTFDAPQTQVWEALLDPTVLAAVLPGCDKLERTGEHDYDGALNIKIGPVQGKFQGKIHLSDLDEPNSYAMKVDGRGAPGFVKATAEVRLEAEGDQTTMHYDSKAQVGGRIASVGQRLLDSSAKAIIKQSLEGLNAAMVARMAAGAAAATDAEGGGDAPAAVAVPTVEAPSQAAFATNVAKEVAKDLLPPWLRLALMVALVALLALIYFMIR